MKQLLEIRPMESQEPLLGYWLAYLHDCRSRTKEMITFVKEEQLNEVFPQQTNTIGALLYHIALIEVDYLYVEILQQDYPDFVKQWLPVDDRDTQGNLSVVKDWTLQQYVTLLEDVRNLLIKTLSEMTLEDFRKVRVLPHYDISPEYVCLFLLQHETSHRGQIQALLHLSL